METNIISNKIRLERNDHKQKVEVWQCWIYQTLPLLVADWLSKLTVGWLFGYTERNVKQVNRMSNSDSIQCEISTLYKTIDQTGKVQKYGKVQSKGPKSSWTTAKYAHYAYYISSFDRKASQNVNKALSSRTTRKSNVKLPNFHVDLRLAPIIMQVSGERPYGKWYIPYCTRHRLSWKLISTVHARLQRLNKELDGEADKFPIVSLRSSAGHHLKRLGC